ncbi:MAG: YtxH domain-containing protein [Clostridium sp.]|uniref:YtxH domain-containing protein n=1 Tax=Clostridium sp. TaxID=1506 RepID=UPI0025BD0F3F|nr:YtxH domain-containing protein [Clostridium sp.]MCE5219718.1 YtxH domain-containing protein [Clostridium sp.]
MKRKSILVAIIVVAISLVGCSANSKTGNNAIDNPNTANNATGSTDNDLTNSTGSAANALRYTAANFKDDVVNAGYKLKESTNTKKNYFSGNETDYLMGNDIVRVYEYNSVNDLKRDISRISQNGLTISGTDANYTRKPYFYTKGNSLIMYEGNEPAYIDHFKTMYGNTLIP